MQADLHPLELGEDVVGKVERAVREDVALAAAQDPEGPEQLVRSRDLLGLAAQVVRVQPGHDAHVAGVVADRDDLVAERLRGAAHLDHGGLPVGRGRVDVEIAADVGQLEQIGRRIAGFDFAQLRWAVRVAQPLVDLDLRRRLRQLSQRGDVLRRSGRAHELRPEAAAPRGNDLDGVAVRGDTDDVLVVLLQNRDDLRQRLDAKYVRVSRAKLAATFENVVVAVVFNHDHWPVPVESHAVAARRASLEDRLPVNESAVKLLCT